MYKDEDKRKEAGKERSRRYRNKVKGVTNQGVTDKALPEGYIGAVPVTPPIIDVIPEGTAQGITAKTIIETRKEIELRTPLTNKPERTAKGNIRVSKPGDDDYDGICTPEWRAERGR